MKPHEEPEAALQWDWVTLLIVVVVVVVIAMATAELWTPHFGVE